MRHTWRKTWNWAVCEKCGCRYRTGNVSRVYEQADGRRTTKADECPGMTKPDMDRAFVRAMQDANYNAT